MHGVMIMEASLPRDLEASFFDVNAFMICSPCDDRFIGIFFVLLTVSKGVGLTRSEFGKDWDLLYKKVQ